jgi:hypothetical protein
MEVNYTLERISDEILKSVGNRSEGYFITLDTQYTKQNIEITKELLETVRDKMVFPFVYAMNSYCYGRSFKRKERMMRTISAIEIGKSTQRLHAHLIMLHALGKSTDRTVDDIRSRSYTIWNSVVPDVGTNMIDVQRFDLTRNWLPYITKGFTTFKCCYDFPSVLIH